MSTLEIFDSQYEQYGSQPYKKFKIDENKSINQNYFHGQIHEDFSFQNYCFSPRNEYQESEYPLFIEEEEYLFTEQDYNQNERFMSSQFIYPPYEQINNFLINSKLFLNNSCPFDQFVNQNQSYEQKKYFYFFDRNDQPKKQSTHYEEFKLSQNSDQFNQFDCKDFRLIKNFENFENQSQIHLGTLQTSLFTNFDKFDYIKQNDIYQDKIIPGQLLQISWTNFQSKGSDLDFYSIDQELCTFVRLNDKYVIAINFFFNQVGYLDHTYCFIWCYLLNYKIINIYPYFLKNLQGQTHIIMEVYLNHHAFEDQTELQQNLNKCVKLIDEVSLKILFNIMRIKITTPSLINKSIQKHLNQLNLRASNKYPKILISCQKTFDYYEQHLKTHQEYFTDFFTQIKNEDKASKIRPFSGLFQSKPMEIDILYPTEIQNVYQIEDKELIESLTTFSNVFIQIDENNEKKYLDTENKNTQLFRFYEQATQPIDVISNMHPYQLQGLQWLLYREKRVETLYIPSKYDLEQQQRNQLDVDFEQMELVGGQKIYRNVFNNKFQLKFPTQQDILGGILADEMGLGKTLMIISLIHQTKKLRNQNYGTLIITPSNLVSQWENQFKNHSQLNSISILNLQLKENRSKNFEDYDVVICSYKILQIISENENQCDMMFKQQWERVILDEAQKIKNKKSKISELCFEVQSKYRWCLTGTPIENSIDDIYSLFRFLNIPKYSDWSWWSQCVKNQKKMQLKCNSFKVVNKIIERITLRRTKESKDINGDNIISLPEKQIQNIFIDLLDNEKSIYNLIFKKTQQVYKFFLQKPKKEKKNYMHIFEVLTKLRRYCVHPCLTFKLEEESFKLSENNTQSIISRVNKFLSDIQSKIQIQNQDTQNIEMEQENEDQQEEKKESSSENNVSQYQKEVIQQIKDGQYKVCSICLEDIEYHSISSCLHVFCSKCLEQSIQANNKCPLCRKHLSMNDVLEFVDQEARIHKELGNYFNDDIISGSKIQKIMEIIEEIHKKGEKVVLFSQWIDTLNLLEKHLTKKQISFKRFEGKLTPAQKLKQLYHFEKQISSPEFQDLNSLKEEEKLEEQSIEQEDSDLNNNQIQENTQQTPTVLLGSLMSGYVGLNLIGANHLILCDSWWNPAIEDQAINRIHRLGQEKQTHIYKLIYRDTIEERIQEINDEKRDIFQTIFSFSGKNSNKKANEYLSNILN